MALVRLVAGVLAAWLFVATVLAVRLPRLAPRFARRLVATIMGGALLVGPASVASAATSAGPPPGVQAPVLHRIEETTTTSTRLSAAPDPVPEPVAAQSVTTVVVQPGDHLWGIAERELSSRLGRPATDDEIVPFWRSVIDLNRGRLVSGDEDLIFVDEAVRLPS
jgi:nucleoid-associated protein YgaU